MGAIEAPLPVLFVTHSFAVGGAESFLVELLNGLGGDRISPVVCSLTNYRDLEHRLHPSISVQFFPKRWRYDLDPALRLAAVIKKWNFASVFALGFYSYFFVRLALLISKKCPRVFVSLHSTKERSKKEHIQRTMYASLLRKQDILVGVCKSQVAYLSQNYHIPLQRFRVIHNGVDLQRWTLPPAGFERVEMKGRLGIPAASPVIIQVAAFRPEKRHDVSLQALELVHRHSQLKPYLAYVGNNNPQNQDKIRRLCMEKGLGQFVIFSGLQHDVRPFYWISDLFTLSSDSETFSIAALEAMASGLPAVLTDVGGAREMITEGVTGYIVPVGQPGLLAEAWLRILEQRERFVRQEIRETISTRFSLSTCIQSYEYLLSTT